MGTARRISLVAACALAISATLHAQTYPTGNDPRNGLKPGKLDAGTAHRGMNLVSFSPTTGRCTRIFPRWGFMRSFSAF